MFHSIRILLNELVRSHNIDAAVYGPSEPNDRELKASWDSVRMIAAKRIGPRRTALAPGLCHALTKANHDILHLHGLWQFPSVAAWAWRRRQGGALMISPHGMLAPWALRQSARKKRIAQLLYERDNLQSATCLHALTEAEAEEIRAAGVRGPIAIVPNGIAPCDTARTTDNPSADKRRTMLFLGRITPQKGVQNLLRAWALLSPDMRDSWRLAIAGWGDETYLAETQALAAQLDLEQDVVFLGPLHGDEKDAVLATADGFILPSFSEGLPMAVLEAFSHGIPTFLTPACNFSQAIRDDAAIEISADPAPLAETLRNSLFRNDLHEIGERGRHLANTHYRADHVAGMMASTYRWLRGDGIRPAHVHLD